MSAETIPTREEIDSLKDRIKRLNSKAGQMKMDLHDLAEGLPTDFEKLPEEAAKTFEIYQEIDRLKTQLKQWEKQTR
ncbi:CCE_0567 family metalloprotein [Pannus brasiliensis CCIBt3594]|uniref:CCE_0567 family metalloprotein n=1 Tax=Pannus brasiliensis CCIBt3594 TaxID=1427578 RepID=A0AAW9QS41_9CHRO